MLSQISWGQYVAYVAVAGLLYYLTIILLYYRSNLLLFFKDPLNSQNRLGSDFSPDEKIRDILGKPTASVNENVVSSSELQFYEHETRGELSDQSSTSIIEDKGSFLSDLNESLIILKEAEGTKEEFCALFQVVSSKYNALAQSSERQATVSVVSDLISAKELNFSLTPQEVDKLWA
ncbi:MAG: hypothetical protein K0S09_780 [Sphingobacteriaceae bacterium]|mgnify:CR=1 FL=1|jgi:hypothetical protein|nr:hypothetical protein [Sphingobacteriaceae bacterium]